MAVREIAAAVQLPLASAMCACSALAFVLMGVDKLTAKLGARRIRERTLLLVAACFGGIGAFLGMQVFRHKTKKPPFPWLLPLFALVQAALLLGAFALSGGSGSSLLSLFS